LLLKRNRLVSLLIIVCTLLYLGQIIFIKPDQAILNKYHISVTTDIFLALAIAIPYVVIWIVSLIGYQRMDSYIANIRGSKDGEAMNLVGIGILLLAIWLPVTTLLDSLIRHASTFHLTVANAVRISNYANILLLLPAFVICYVGSRRLLELIRSWRMPSTIAYVTTAYIAFASFYTWLVLHDPVRKFGVHGVNATFYEPDWLILLTIVIPRLIMWYYGILTVYNLYLYRTRVNGSLYREAIGLLALGLGGVVSIAIILRLFQSVTTTLNNLSLGQLVLVVYILLILIATAYVFIAKGAQKMQRLEEL
jgi:hypothetical protein